MPRRPRNLPEVVPPRALRIEELFNRDLTINPPQGFPSLREKQAALVRYKAQNPSCSWTEAFQAAGFSESTQKAGIGRVTADVRLYLQAIQQGVAAQMEERGEDPGDLRDEVVRRLALEIRSSEDGRVAVAAAKVLHDYLPTPEQEQAETAKLSPEALETRCNEAFSRACDHELGYQASVKRLISIGCLEPALPYAGNEGFSLRPQATQDVGEELEADPLEVETRTPAGPETETPKTQTDCLWTPPPIFSENQPADPLASAEDPHPEEESPDE